MQPQYQVSRMEQPENLTSQNSQQTHSMIIPDFVEQSMDGQVLKQYVGWGGILRLFSQEVYMKFKDYQDVRIFYETNRWKIFQDGRIPWDSKYHLALLTAKAYYLRHDYQSVLKTIEQNLAVPTPKLSYLFKIFYERSLLLLKSLYLQNQPSEKLNQVLKEYNTYKVNCLDWQDYIEKDSDLYDETMELLEEKLEIGCRIIKNKEGNFGGLTDWIQNVQVKPKIFQGIPIYLISKKWMAKALQFAKNPKQNPHPGPVYNLQLSNHIFEFQKHNVQNKFYMNQLLFPIVYQVDYYVLSSKQWKETQSIFKGQQLKRFPIQDDQFSIAFSSDCIVKTLVECFGLDFIFQWQAGLSWQYSILPSLRVLFGMGQLKYLYQKTNRNNVEYIQEALVENGIIQSSKNRYKFTEISQQIIPKVSIKLFNQILIKFNLQPYENNPNPEVHSQGVIALSTNEEELRKYSIKLKKKFGLEQNIDIQLNIQEIHCFLSCIGSIGALVEPYRGPTFIEEISKAWSDEQIQYALGFSDFIKKMWYSSYHQDSINPMPLIRQFLCYSLQKYLQKSNYTSFPYKKTQSHQITHQFEQLLIPLHHIQIYKKQQLIYSQFQMMRYTGITNFNKSHPQKIFNVFNQFHYQQFCCQNCKSSIGYRLLPKLTMLVDVKQCWEYLKVYLVTSEPVDDYDGYVMMQTKLIKVVYQVYLKLPKKKTVKDVMMILSKKFNIKLEKNKKQIISILLNTQCQEFQQIQQTSSVKELNALVQQKNNSIFQKNDKTKRFTQGKQNKWHLFMFLVDQISSNQELILVKFKNPITDKNKAFPELIKIPLLRNSLSDGYDLKENKQSINRNLSNPTIVIEKFKIFHKKQKYTSIFRVISAVNIWTKTKMGSRERTSRHTLEFPVEQEKSSDKYSMTLLECIRNTYDYENQHSMKNSKNMKIKKSLEEYSGKIFCHRCKKEMKSLIKVKLLEFQRVIAIGLNRKNTTVTHRISTRVKFPQLLNHHEFLPQSTTLSSKKSPQYLLKSIVLFQSELTQQPNSKTKQKYATVVRSVNDKNWYLLQNQSKRLIDIEDVDERRVDMLIYEQS